MNEPNWPKINRAISESIEPKPPFDGMDSNHDGILSDTRIWKWEWLATVGHWVEARNWREPAAAMELLKRGMEANPSEFWHIVCTLVRGKHPWRKLEDAIVLAYYAALELNNA